MKREEFTLYLLSSSRREKFLFPKASRDMKSRICGKKRGKITKCNCYQLICPALKRNRRLPCSSAIMSQSETPSFKHEEECSRHQTTRMKGTKKSRLMLRGRRIRFLGVKRQTCLNQGRAGGAEAKVGAVLEASVRNILK